MMKVEKRYAPESTVRSTCLGLLSGWLGGRAT
jgi:hypothetical protein